MHGMRMKTHKKYIPVVDAPKRLNQKNPFWEPNYGIKFLKESPLTSQKHLQKSQFPAPVVPKPSIQLSKKKEMDMKGDKPTAKILRIVNVQKKKIRQKSRVGLVKNRPATLKKK